MAKVTRKWIGYWKVDRKLYVSLVCVLYYLVGVRYQIGGKTYVPYLRLKTVPTIFSSKSSLVPKDLGYILVYGYQLHTAPSQ